MATKNNDGSGCFVVVLALLGLFVWFFILPARWTDPIQYSMEYSINSDQVHWTPEPTDCDFIHAPLGAKGCHYKKTVTAYNAAGYAVAGDDAAKWGHDTNTGKPIISYDNGKTWAWLPADAPTTPDLTVKMVEIDWVKVTD
jgi:hypothetical protein